MPDASKGSIRCFTLSHGLLLAGPLHRALPWRNVDALGPHAVMVHDASAREGSTGEGAGRGQCAGRRRDHDAQRAHGWVLSPKASSPQVSHKVFRADYAHQPQLVEDALGKQMLALLVQLEAACTAADQLAEAAEEAFPQHPDAEVILISSGLGIRLGARVLAEIGDDENRFADARDLKAYAGASPVTRASGKKCSITRRWVKNGRLNAAGPCLRR